MGLESAKELLKGWESIRRELLVKTVSGYVFLVSAIAVHLIKRYSVPDS